MERFSEPADLAINIHGTEFVEAVDSSRQRLRLLKHHQLGLILVIDDEVQHAEAWQALYHEPLVHLSASFVPNVVTALVLGGGSLFAASEILRYPTLERCILVDHDPAVLELMARHYPHARAVLADPRFTYIEGEAISYLSQGGQGFDLIVNDCVDLLNVPGDLDPFSLLKSRLSKEGVCGDVIYRHLLERAHVKSTRMALSQIGDAAVSLVVVPEYPGTLHALTVWGGPYVDQQASTPVNRVQLGWCADNNLPPLEFYDPKHLSFHLYLPPFLRRLWQSGLRQLSG